MKTIFDKTALGRLQIKNRIIRSATWEGMANPAGEADAQIVKVYEALARGGVGAIITGFTSVCDNDRYFGGMVRLSNDGLIAGHKRLTEAVHRYHCPVLAQLALGEYNGSYRDMDIDDLTAADIEHVKALFVAAARRAKRADYDGVQIHAAHGFFLSRFISPAHNHRTDAYGGSAENRGKIAAEIVHTIKRELPDLHITMKINCSDFLPGGLTAEESRQICLQCVQAGLESIEISGAGTSVSGIKAGVNEAYFKDYALALCEETEVPVILVGGHRSIEMMNRVLNEGNIQLLSVSRPLICEPDLVNRWLQGDTSPARCISCNMCYRTENHRCIMQV